MKHSAGKPWNEWTGRILATAGVVSLTALSIVGMLAAPPLLAQSPSVNRRRVLADPPVQLPTPQWQTDAGGKMAFDVASIKVNNVNSAEEGMRPNFPLNLGPTFGPVGSLFSVTNASLRTLIGFAFKLSIGQTHFLMPGLPSWVDDTRFDISARAAINNPTKDQFRLMLQSLLADRFKLTMHHETRQLPSFEVIPLKPGKTGPQLTPHVDDAKCGAEGRPDAPPAPADLSPFTCGGIVIGLRAPIAGRVRAGGRNVSMDYIAAFLTGTGFQGVSNDRLIVNETGLAGQYDFWMEFVPEFQGPVSQELPPPDPNGPTFLEALQEQLGLKLKSATGPVDVLVIDHVEEPSPN